MPRRRLFGYGQQQGAAASGTAAAGGAAGGPVEVEMHGGGGGGMGALMQRPPLRGPFAEKVGREDLRPGREGGPGPQ